MQQKYHLRGQVRGSKQPFPVINNYHKHIEYQCVFIFNRFPVAIWNFLFLRIFLERISTADDDCRTGQYHTDALVDAC